MNAEKILSFYDKIAEAPEAVSSLRRFVHDCAVSGRLVKQNPGDEKAVELLHQIRKEQDERQKKGDIKKVKPCIPVKNSPFQLPAGWTWIPLGQTGNIFSGNSINAETRKKLGELKKGKPFVATKDVGYGYDPINYENGLTVSHSDDSFRVARAAAVLICAEGGSAGRKIGVTDRKICFGNKLLANETWSVVLPAFLTTVYLSGYFRSEFTQRMKGIIGGISINNFLQIPFPLPPLAEQRRIVARVDELMALCDRLESAKEEGEEIRENLTTVSFARLGAPSSNSKEFKADVVFALSNLNSLTAHSAQVVAVRQTIFNLALRGKLVEQKLDDEPASELLKRISRQKFKKKKFSKPLPTINSSDLGVLPKGWSSAPLIALGDWATGSGFPKNEQGKAAGPYLFLKVSDMNLPGNEKYITTANNYVDDAAVSRMRAKIHKPRTIIFPKIGGAIATNKRRILTHDSAIDNNCLGITFSQHINIEWAFILLISYDFTLYQSGTALPALQQGSLAAIPVALPPLAEQKRIVAKVDELMALCDELEANLAAGDAARKDLMAAVLREAFEAPA